MRARLAVLALAILYAFAGADDVGSHDAEDLDAYTPYEQQQAHIIPQEQVESTGSNTTELEEPPPLVSEPATVHSPIPVVPTVQQQEQALAASGGDCELLPGETGVVFSQADAPFDIGKVVVAFTKMVNRELTGVVKVKLDWGAEHINGIVGLKFVRADVVRKMPQGDTVEMCYMVPFHITDVDECATDPWHKLAHKCHVSAKCVNTHGSYECVCPDGSFGVTGSGSHGGSESHMFGATTQQPGACGGQLTTEECCAIDGCEKHECGSNCKKAFRCTDDHCLGNSCSKDAVCIPNPAAGMKAYTCQCNDDFEGDGHQCTAIVWPDFCDNNACPRKCECLSQPRLGGYLCPPSRGHVTWKSPDADVSADHVSIGGQRLDDHSCVHDHAPKIILAGASSIVLSQGDTYVEYGVEIDDENVEDTPRQLTINYDDPELASEYVTVLGDFVVNYELATPWLPSPLVSKVRRVKVVDVDECQYTGDLDLYKNQCVPCAAHCHNTQGSYECVCAKGYEGDGFVNGTGCVDVVKPKVRCQGMGCKPIVFTAASLQAFVGGAFMEVSDTLNDEFCETFLQKVPSSAFCSDDGGKACFSATDDSCAGTVDLTDTITVGEMERLPDKELTWRVEHTVCDAAGNCADDPAYQYITVKRVSYAAQLFGDGVTFTLSWGKVYAGAVAAIVAIAAGGFMLNK
jgi:hypothetical protein